MLKLDNPNRECLVVNSYNIIKELKTKLKSAAKEAKPDKLENYITSIFGNIGNIDKQDGANGAETIKVIHDDYNHNNQTTLDFCDWLTNRIKILLSLN